MRSPADEPAADKTIPAQAWCPPERCRGGRASPGARWAVLEPFRPARARRGLSAPGSAAAARRSTPCRMPSTSRVPARAGPAPARTAPWATRPAVPAPAAPAGAAVRSRAPSPSRPAGSGTARTRTARAAGRPLPSHRPHRRDQPVRMSSHWRLMLSKRCLVPVKTFGTSRRPAGPLAPPARRSSLLPLAVPQRRRLPPVGWREKRRQLRAASAVRQFQSAARGRDSRIWQLSGADVLPNLVLAGPARTCHQERLRRRLRRSRTLDDRTCPKAPEFAAIGNRDKSGQDNPDQWRCSSSAL